ncbi:SOS response-associated peptidase [Agromyces sp. SYSU K20354]|uniref:SOS response-associated peptidase n=1 Tax=Agromyces cavernae TaxID=2898659 RepID=UPI001E5052E1|nr:SOS response-associated peptidase [Agromyces cavernae]MCD2444336.1 SOS response-associated peptidase [Agromyces cavernae]
MCGRFTLKERPADLAAAVGALEGDFSSWQPSFNIPPTATIPVLVEAKLPDSETFGRRLEPARWGLVPGWSKELKLKFPTFNARSEGIAEKNTWRGPLKSHRAIVPMDGWSEWTGEKGAKMPHFIHHPDGETLGVAGLYSWWLDRSKPDDDDTRWTLTATILTSDAVDELVGIHDRSPVPLPRELWDWWLDPSLVGDQAMVDDAVKAALPIAEQLAVYSVRPFKVGQDGPALIEPADA